MSSDRANNPRRPGAQRAALAAGLAAAALPLAGCLERRMYITSDPPGALVTLNDVEVGRTPAEVDFEWYGVYDVRLTLEGYRTLVTSAEAKAPLHETPGIDLAALLLPVKFTNDVRWHFTLEPLDDAPESLIERAGELRGQLPPPPEAETAEPTPAPEEPTPAEPAPGETAEPEPTPQPPPADQPQGR